ncbi:MAG: T9SS type A sorting domain-containing protein [Pseudoflavonifractor sp.]|nr:T9SS type A sorting domain-containing protein [Pseudoflavonifractor sp.]
MKRRLHFAIAVLAALFLSIPSVAAELGKVYLVGDPTGWAEPSEANAAIYNNWALIETTPGSNVYEGKFTIEGDHSVVNFRFCTALAGWTWDDAISADGPTSVLFDKSGAFEGAVMLHNNNYTFMLVDWTTDYVKFILDLNSRTLSLETQPIHAAPDHIYVINGNDRSNSPVPGNESVFSRLTLDRRISCYVGSVYVEPGKFKLNFIPVLTNAGWDAPTMCPRFGGDAEVVFDGSACSATIDNSGEPGYWTYPDWPGGYVTIQAFVGTEVKFYDYNRIPKLYFVGSPHEFMTPIEDNASDYGDWELSRISDCVYEGVFDVDAIDNVQFRFMSALRGWTTDTSIGSQAEDFTCTDIPLYNGTAVGNICLQGLGNWSIGAWPGGSLKFRVDLITCTLTVTNVASGLDVAVVPATSFEAEEGGIRVTAVAPTEVSVYNVSGALVKTVQLPAGESHVALPAGFYIVNGHKLMVR